MRYELLIGLRYLRAKRKEIFISLITAISMLGVTLGVMTLNVVLSVMTGFEEDLRDRILGFNPHVVVGDASTALPDAEALTARVRAVPGVVAAAPFVSGQVMLAVRQNVAGAMVRGVEADSRALSELTRRLREGAVADLARAHEVAAEGGGSVALPGVIVGKEMARQLGLLMGDAVTLVSPVATPTAIGMLPKVKRFVVVGVFDSGMAEYDGSLIYLDLAQAQRFFDLGTRVSGVEVWAVSLEQARPVAARIRTALGAEYRVRDWMERNRNLFSALRLEKTVYFIVLLLIVLVAAFNIVATLVMVVIEKRKDIAVLKSMGATAPSIARIFVFKGMIIGAVGTVAGNLAGFAACWVLQRYEFIPLPRDVFYVTALPVRIYPQYFALVTLASLLICLLATVYPARQAARLTPVDVIRYD